MIMEKKDKELENCNFVKTILMLCVVLYHSMLFWGGKWFSVVEPVFKSDVLIKFSEWLNTFHIYGFTLVSGYIFYYLKYEKKCYNEFKSFLVNKFKRLIVPYIFIVFLWMIPTYIYFFGFNISTIIEKYLLGISPSQLWFLLMLFWVFIIVYLFSNFIKKHTLLSFVFVIILYMIGFIGCQLSINFFHIFNALRYVTFFVLGFKIRQFKFTKNSKYVLLLIPLHIILFFLKDYISSFNGVIFKIINIFINYTLNIVGALMSFYCLQYLANKINYNNKVFNFLSQKSMSIYLFHQQIIYFFIVIFNGVVNPYVHTIINFIGSIIVSILITSLFMKFKFTKFMIGEK